MGGKASTRPYGGHPMVQFVRSLEGEFYLAREVAEQLGCSRTMLAYLCNRSDPPLGPTHRAQYGSVVLNLYTPERVAELAEYYKQVAKVDKGNHRRGPTPMWTQTEARRRIREQNRVVNYRVRAAACREQGREKEAIRLENLTAPLLAKLEKAKIQRWEKVHGRPYGTK